MNYGERATQYARDVVAGRVVACRWVVLACERHIADLKRKAYRFDHELVHRACQFIEYLPHTKGEWAGQSIQLEEWQTFFVGSLFGWVHADTGKRRFRKASLYVPRKNGKSILGAAIGLYMFTLDGEAGAEVYSGASSEKQAWEVFGPARVIAKRSPEFVSGFDITINAKTLARLGDGSKFEPVIGNPGDGASPHCAIIDEYHEHKTSTQYDTMLTGMGARSQPLLLVISTAGDDIEGPCYDDFRTVQRVLAGEIVDDEQFGVIYTVDAEDEWDDPAGLDKANPNIGVSVSRQFLEARLREAVQNARHQYRFKIKHLNVWVTSRSAFYNAQSWQVLGDTDVSLESMRGRSCFVAADLASKIDVAALGFLFTPEGSEAWTFIPRFYVPESRLEEPGLERYVAWTLDEHLVTTDGSKIDLQRIQDDLADYASWLNIQGVAYDPWQAAQMAANLEKAGLPVVEYRQTWQMMCEPMKESEALILEGKIRHDGNPAMTWMMGNVVGKTDAKDNVYPTKERAEDKIDGPIALIMALGMALREENTESVYRTRGLVVV